MNMNITSCNAYCAHSGDDESEAVDTNRLTKLPMHLNFTRQYVDHRKK